jgi:hypothetical protein
MAKHIRARVWSCGAVIVLLHRQVLPDLCNIRLDIVDIKLSSDVAQE